MRKPIRFIRVLVSVAVLLLIAGGIYLFCDFETVDRHYMNHPEEIPEGAEVVTLSVDCLTLSENPGKVPAALRSSLPEDYRFLLETPFLYTEGMTPFDLLMKAERAYRLRVDYTGGKKSAYVTSIGDLAEFSCGNESGWIVFVNGEPIPLGSASVKLQPGDSVRWAYTVSLGDLFEN